MHKNSAELPCKDKKIILRNPRNYKLRAAIPYPGFVRTASINQSRRSDFYKYIDR